MMVAKKLFFSFSIILTCSWASGLQTVNGRIKITTVTTSACLDTVNFIRDELVPAYLTYMNYLDIEFIPWGRTVNHGNGTFTCQFGDNDCFANRLHRCVLDLLKGYDYMQVLYMACELSPPYPGFAQGSYACVREMGVDIAKANYCVNNPDRDTLDEAAEAAAAGPMATINFVPAIVFNNVIDVNDHNQARRRLSSMICFALAEDPTTGIFSCQI